MKGAVWRSAATRVLVHVAALAVFVTLNWSVAQPALRALVVGMGALTAAFGLLVAGGYTQRSAVQASFVVGIIVAECAGALTFWKLAPVVAGATAWLSFYTVEGLVERAQEGSLTRTVAAEYSAVALVGAAVVLLTAH